MDMPNVDAPGPGQPEAFGSRGRVATPKVSPWTRRPTPGLTGRSRYRAGVAGTVAVWGEKGLGIRRLLFLGTALLMTLGTGMGLYSGHLTSELHRSMTEHERETDASVAAARAAFAGANRLSLALRDLARAENPRGLGLRANAVSRALVASQDQLDRMRVQLHRGGWLPEATAIVAVTRTETEVQTSLAQLVEAVGTQIEADAAVADRHRRLKRAFNRYFRASSKVEVSMRTRASRVLAIDLVEAAQQGRLQRRLDRFFEREMSWVATSRDLVKDGLELFRRATELLASSDRAALREGQEGVRIYAKRLQVYRRLPDSETRRMLATATSDYVALASGEPTLEVIRGRVLTGGAARAAALDRALADCDRLKGHIYDLTQRLTHQARQESARRQSSLERRRALLQAVTIAAGILVLALVYLFLAKRAIRPLERLTARMRRISDELDRGGDGSLADQALPTDEPALDEVRAMTRALRLLQRTLADREQALQRKQLELQRLAHHDFLTGLPNRALLAERIEQAVHRADRNGQFVAVALLDLDGFKAVNDEFGHDLGDQMLKRVADLLTASVRLVDTVARCGGDEFVFLLPDLEQPEDAEPVLRRTLNRIGEPSRLDGGIRVQVKASIGYTLYPLDDNTGDTLIRHADQAMYDAKRSGGNQLWVYGDDGSTRPVGPAPMGAP